MTEPLFFNIGWDYAAHGVRPYDHAVKECMKGYEQGRLHFGARTIPADRFVKKWLQLRYNAASRRRVFDDDVTPEFIRSITPEYCPIVLCKMTFGTLEDTDWSVDRIINDGAYSRRNLFVMSTRANKAKGDIDLVGMQNRFYDLDQYPALERIEWARLYSVMQTAYGIAGLIPDQDYMVLPVISPFPYYIGAVWDQYVQIQLALYAIVRALPAEYKVDRKVKDFAAIKSSCRSPASIRLFESVQKNLLRHQLSYDHPLDVWWRPHLLHCFQKLYDLQKKEGVWPIAGMSMNLVDAQADMDAYCKELSLKTKGYL